MAEKRWFIPADGCTVRDPATRKIVPPAGQEVEATTYWVGLVEHENGVFRADPVVSESTEVVGAEVADAPSKSKSVKKESNNG